MLMNSGYGAVLETAGRGNNVVQSSRTFQNYREHKTVLLGNRIKRTGGIGWFHTVATF